MMMKKTLLALSVLAPLTTGRADDSTTTTTTPPQSVTVNAFVSLAYVHNLERPASRSNALRVFDFDDRSMKVDVAEVVVQKAAVEPGSAGFRVDIAAGSSIPRVSAAAGLFRDSQGHAEDVDLQQAYLSWIAPIGRGLRLDVGKFVTHAGAEVIEGYDGYNDNYSRSFLFGYAIPFTHTGLKATYPVSDVVTVMGMVTNGWDNVKDNNAAKSFGGQIVVTPSKAFSITANYIGGPERDGNDHDFRHLVDVIVGVSPSSWLAITLNADYAVENGALADGASGKWKGLAAGLRLGSLDKAAFTIRAEEFRDPDGLRTGTAQRLRELTVTGSVRIAPSVLLRGEFRVDGSDARPFEHSDAASAGTQRTLSLNAIASF